MTLQSIPIPIPQERDAALKDLAFACRWARRLDAYDDPEHYARKLDFLLNHGSQRQKDFLIIAMDMCPNTSVRTIFQVVFAFADKSNN